MLYRIARLKNHFVICHHNEITIELSKQFRENHIPFVVVDPREDLASIAEKYKYPYYVKEEPHTEIALLKSYLSSARGIITLSENTADNIAQIASARLYEKEINNSNNMPFGCRFMGRYKWRIRVTDFQNKFRCGSSCYGGNRCFLCQ